MAGKSGGSQFAERQLLRHGWEHGKGLGREENGITEAIKVKVKCDKGGVGHKEGDQFTFHWWDHVFNKTSASLEVQADHIGKKLSNGEDEKNGISNKKPLKMSLARDKVYGTFVKSATLLSGQEHAVVSALSSDSSSSDEDENKLDLSSTTKLSDVQLMKACGGRTAHKGARHGLSMSAKLARLEQQEAEFMAKYGKKAQPEENSREIADHNENTEVVKSKKKKKKGKDCTVLEAEVCLGETENGHTKKLKKKSKKKKRECVELIEEMPPLKKKKRKKSKE